MKLLILFALIFFTLQSVQAQETSNNSADFRLSLTIEPLNYIAKGHSIWLGVRYKKVGFGLVTFSAHSKKNILFDQHENLDIRLQKGIAFFARYFTSKKPSSPFVGFLLGTEEWNIQNKTNPNSRNLLKNAFFTPQIGYQWSTLNNRLIINPNVRMIVPFNVSGHTELEGINHELKSAAFLPALDLGLGIPLK